MRTDQDKKFFFELVIHWKGRVVHTQLAMERPRLPATENRHAYGGAGHHSLYGCSLRRRPDCLGIEPTRLFCPTGKGKLMESDSRGDSQAQPFHCRSKSAALPESGES